MNTNMLTPLITLFALITLSLHPAFAEQQVVVAQTVNWSEMHLSPHQRNAIERVESDWKETYESVQPKIQQDRQQLHQMLQSSGTNQREVMALQNRIRSKEQFLHQEALRSFMQKKEHLTPEQRKRLHFRSRR